MNTEPDEKKLERLRNFMSEARQWLQDGYLIEFKVYTPGEEYRLKEYLSSVNVVSFSCSSGWILIHKDTPIDIINKIKTFNVQIGENDERTCQYCSGTHLRTDDCP